MLKTVEMIVDFRRHPSPQLPLTLSNCPVLIVEIFMFLGTTVSKDLKWENNINSILKKAQQRMYFLRLLRKHGLPQELLRQFCTAVTESVLCSSITVWFGATTMQLQRTVRTAEKKSAVPPLTTRGFACCQNYEKSMQNPLDPPHPRHNLFQHLPSDPAVDKELTKAILARQFHPSVIGPETWEGYIFSGLEIRIKESTDLYGAVLWPSAMVLCHFLETHRDKYNLMDKNVIELGAGTGLVSIVSSLLGAKVTSTDLPDVLGNLQYNVTCNTKGRCKYTPVVCGTDTVTELVWGPEVEQRFPQSTHYFDYILAADVVYAHSYLDQLLDTFNHLCQVNTQILWTMRFRLEPENSFVDRFSKHFHLEELYDLPSLSIKLYRAWRRDKRTKDQ
ncbi:protein-lysine methyltransferase METTL21E-like isoform X2 [Phyllopteryx taeniolatus]|uniref:protein-lysine methyltransferase METTL21E-like isoform X2 n=1 Tax=Phyllopteryx taeniolatus TaxID=161469 RepID=UPI002AD5A54B|nr:protein-lysine methyltransferase METTL21E-like isoform X2 [Phyllopteryx taeniolatus]